jgi:hypothetical protein
MTSRHLHGTDTVIRIAVEGRFGAGCRIHLDVWLARYQCYYPVIHPARFARGVPSRIILVAALHETHEEVRTHVTHGSSI